MKENIIIYGAGGHAKVVADIIEKEQKYNVLGFLDDFKEPGSNVYGYKVLGGIDFIGTKEGDVLGGIVALGDNWLRKVTAEKIKTQHPMFRFVSAIHPFSSVGRGVEIGGGTVVMAGSIINSDAKIGDHCIVNTKSSVGHDSVLKDFTTVAPGATIAGGVEFGECSTMSIGSTVIHGKKIGEHTVIGAGSTVIDDLPPYVVSYGTPSKVVRSRKESDKYL